MKKVLLSIALALFMLPGFAQVTKGMKTFGIDFSIQSSSNENQGSDNTGDYMNTAINPRIGLLLSNTLELGLGISYSYYKNKYESASSNYHSENSEGIFSILPYVKWYHPISEHFYFNLTLETGVGMGSMTQENSGLIVSKDESDVSVFSVSLVPEFSYTFNNHWGLNFGLGSMAYKTTTHKDTETDAKNTDTSFGFFGSFAGGLSLGATYYF